MKLVNGADPDTRQSRPARVGGARIETFLSGPLTDLFGVAPPAWAGRGLKLHVVDLHPLSPQSPRPRGRGAD